MGKKARKGRNDTIPPGRIFSLSSQASHLALDGHGAYCASKAGLNGLVHCEANGWGRYGITCNTVSPTVTSTVLGIKTWSKGKQRDDHNARIPTERFVEPDEVAKAMKWLCQDGSGWVRMGQDGSGMVNGADARVDGGFTISGGFTAPAG